MRGCVAVVGRLCTLYILASVVAAFPQRIPIGAVFDRRSLQSTLAFQYAVDRYNSGNATTLVKINRYEKIVDSDDSYQLKRAVCSRLSKGSFLLLLHVLDPSLSMLNSYASRLNVPLVSSGNAFNSSVAFSINLRPLYHGAIIDIMKHYHWRNTFYVYDTDEGLSRLELLFTALQDRGRHLDLQVIRLTDVDDSYDLLRRLDEKDPDDDKYIILDLSGQHALQAVLTQIKHIGMNRASYHYLLGGMVMDELDLAEFKYGGVNITGLRLIDPARPLVRAMRREWRRLEPRYWDTVGTATTIKLESALTIDAVTVIVAGLTEQVRTNKVAVGKVFRRGQVFNHDLPGISCDDHQSRPWVLGEDIMKSLLKTSFEGLTGWVQFDKRGLRTNYTLDVLELNLDREPTKIGSWSSKSGLTIQKRAWHDPTKEKRHNRTRIVTSVEAEPYLKLRTTPENGTPLVGNARYEGYAVDLAREVARVVGFDYVIQLVKKYGEELPNRTWDGMVGQLTQNKADLAIAPLTITSLRERVIDFSKPFMSLGISIMIKKPEKQKPGVFSFMDPLSYKIWLYVILAYIGVSLVLFLVSRFSPYEWQIEDSAAGPTFTNDFTIMNSLWFALGAIMQQGCDISPRSLSGRIVGAVWWFCTLILISSYTANLAAFLTVERMLTPIESADDLADQTVIQYGVVGSGSTKAFFKNSEIEVYTKMWNFMRDADPPVFVQAPKDGVRRVRDSKSKYAFLLESTMNDYYNQRKPCNTMKVGGNLDSKGYGIATPLNSDLREKISLAVLQMGESGELAKLQKKWWYDKGECPQENDGGSKQSALTLSNVAGVFYILIGGLGLSMLTSLLEFIYKSKKETKRQEKRYTSSKPIATKSITSPRRDGDSSRRLSAASRTTVPIARSSAISLV